MMIMMVTTRKMKVIMIIDTEVNKGSGHDGRVGNDGDCDTGNTSNDGDEDDSDNNTARVTEVMVMV